MTVSVTVSESRIPTLASGMAASARCGGFFCCPDT